MSQVATHRMIDASAALGPAERALLNLWIHRGLDDSDLARMTGLSPDSLADRRRRIVEALSEELGLPPEQIQTALTEIAAGNAQPPASADRSNGASPAPAELAAEPPVGVSHNGTEPSPEHPDGGAAGAAVGAETGPEAGQSRNGHVPVAAAEEVAIAVGGSPPATEPEPTPATEPEPTSATEPEPTSATEPEPTPATAPGSARRRGAWIMTAVAGLLAVAVVALIAFGSSGSKPHHRRAVAVRSTAAPTPPPSPTSPSPSPRVSRPPVLPLAALPGGLGHATGSLRLIGKRRSDLRLRLSVKGLPAPSGGHYEVWLYNSILDSQPLTRLRASRHAFTIKLPRDAHRYRWIDISFQPAGVINHSGESVLRSRDPAAVSKARLKKRSSRRPHRLRRATTGSKAASTSK